MAEIPQRYNDKPLVHAWTYYAKDGVPCGVVGRYQEGDGKKDIVPFFKRNGSGWIAGIDLNPRPLFGLDKLAQNLENKAVWIVEGEKSAAALQSMGICSVTSLGGSNAAKQTDWTPLNGFKLVYLLPDNDEAGEHYAQDVYRALAALESPPTVKILRLAGLPDGGDIVDWLQCRLYKWNGYTPVAENFHTLFKEQLKEQLQKAELVPDSWKLTNPPVNEVSHWEQNPIEINIKLKAVIPFDFNLLPDSLTPWVGDIALRMQCPPDYVAVAAMVALSAVVGKKGMVMPREKDNWEVCPNLWGLNIGRPSAMKSPASSEGIKPLQRLEIEAKDAFHEAMAVDEAQSFIHKEGRLLAEKHAKALVKEKKFSEAKQLLLDNPEESIKPTRTRYLVNDTTIEKLGELLNENPNGLMLYRDEINGFFKTINREDRSNDRAFYVEAFDGKSSYTFDRIGRGTIDIASVCVAMLGNIQPSVLNPHLMHAIKGGANDDGMVQRFQMMVYPDLGAWQNIDQWADKNAKDEAFSVFTRIAAWDGFTEPARFSPDAQVLFNEWYIRLNLELRSNDILPVMESHYGKYKSLIPSLAVLIHLADNTDHSQVISISSVRRAIAWGVYLKSHAERVYSMALDPIDANAKTILNKIESGKLSDGFGTGDILRGGWSGLDSLENIKASLTRLMEYGWIKQLPIKPMSQGGRPAIRYQIHPKLL
ncbi:MAG: DUF3987 domain-containing protein [Methylococcales bacterium]|nr:DUF3987 domain-containing protein [Methylococcales bacterium]